MPECILVPFLSEFVRKGHLLLNCSEVFLISGFVFCCFFLCHLSFHHVLLLYRVLAQVFDLFKGQHTLLELLLFRPGWQCFDYDGRRTESANDILDVVVQLKFTFGEWTFEEAALSIAKLAQFIVTPEEECTIVKSCHAVTSSA